MSPSPGGIARALRHASGMRAVEVLVLQASPALGAIVAGGASAAEPRRLALLLAGSLLLTAHVFVFNDWAGESGDLNDPRRAVHAFVRRGITGGDVGALAVLLLATALLALAAVGLPSVILGTAIAVLGVLYSGSGTPGKGVPVLASLLHLTGGALHFLLGYTLLRPLDGRGLAIAAFFGLVFAGGHLNQEVRDRDVDARNGIRTNAVVFGSRATFVASVVVFTAAYADLLMLALVGPLPRTVAAATLLWPLHVGWSIRALLRGLGFEQARWMQRRYRLLFALVGLLIVASLVARRVGAVQQAGRGHLPAITGFGL